MEEGYLPDKPIIKVALVLGGGGVRGLAHIGVIRVLEKEIPINMIVGTSMGAVVGALYALNPDIKETEKKLKAELERKELKEIETIISGRSPSEEKKFITQNLLTFVKQVYLINLRAVKRWVFSGKEIGEIFESLGFNTDFEKVKIPFSCLSVDLRTGDEVIMNKGNIKEAVLASVSLPGVFPPVKQGERLLVDGGIISSVPVDAAKELGADVIIAVDVEAKIDYDKKLGNGLDMMFQSDAIRAFKLNQFRLKTADAVIHPQVGSLSWASFSKAEDCIKAGEEAAEKAKSSIIELVKKKHREKFWKEFFSLPKYNE